MAGPVEPRSTNSPGDRDGDRYAPGDPANLRVSDEDRHKVAEILREAAGEGRIDLEELDERLEATYAAKTYSDLVPITLDLPVAPSASTPVPRPAARPAMQTPVPGVTHSTSIAVMSGATRRGVWSVGERYTAFAFCGGVDIDLREAQFTARETVIYANAIWGGIDIVVNEHTHVIVEGIGIMGGFEEGRARVAANLTADSPVVRVKGVALMAGVSVTRKAMPGQEPKRRLLGR